MKKRPKIIRKWPITLVYKPMNTGPFQGVQADVPGDFRTMSTGSFQDVQADVSGDLRTFKLDVCVCGSVLLVISFATESQIKTATFVVLLGPYIWFWFFDSRLKPL